MTVAGREIRGPGPDRGVVFQSPCLLPWLTALENVRLGVDQVFASQSRAEREEIAAHYLELVGLGDDRHKRPAELSAGMRQRVGIARAFALSPKVLLLDEPFGMLDSLTRYELQQVLIDLWSHDRKTALMVTHDVDEALFLSDRVAMMTSGPEARLGGVLEVPFPRPRDAPGGAGASRTTTRCASGSSRSWKSRALSATSPSRPRRTRPPIRRSDAKGRAGGG